jgi:hypothetical protein
MGLINKENTVHVTADSITDVQIRGLLADAEKAGDVAAADTCRFALSGAIAHRAQCAAALNAARAKREQPAKGKPKA